MGKLEARFPAHQPVLQTEGVTLSHEPGFAIAKWVARWLSDEDRRTICELMGVEKALSPNEVGWGATALVFNAPNEAIWMGDEDEVLAISQRMARSQLAERGFVVPLTDGRSSFRLNGPLAPDVLSSLVPIDFHPQRFDVNRAVTTVFGDTGVFVLRVDGPSTYRILVDQAYSWYAWRMLMDACNNI